MIRFDAQVLEGTAGVIYHAITSYMEPAQVVGKKFLHVVSVSGGKDSAATLLLAIERFGRENVRAIFCDTGNEHELTYEYLKYLEVATGVIIATLKADFSDDIARKRMFIARDVRHKRGSDGRKMRWSNKAKRRALAVLYPTGVPFLDMCMWKGRFPSRKAQFCTEELKRNMAVSYQLDLIDQGYTVISWQGVRRDESFNRRNALSYESVGGGLHIFRPIATWTAAQVFAHCKRWGLKPNPLYLQGMGRVGCMPCINAAKAEVHEIAIRFVQHIDKIFTWEQLVGLCSKRNAATFFHKSSGKGLTNQEIVAASNVWQVVEWAKTSRGGKQFSLLTALEEPTSCASSYGLCE
ncbi:MAG: phosphoadenosine phosphosulfate reductase family protein [Pseudomonadota bacterium]